MQKLFFSLALLSSSLTLAVDRWNTYQWNRPDAIPTPLQKNQDWFEWWYYKVVLPETDEAFYFVYGVVNPADEKQQRTASGAYVGFGSFSDKAVLHKSFPLNDFHAEYNHVNVNIGLNRATEKHLEGSIQDSKTGETAQWNIDVEKDWGFNAMGWSTGIPGISNIYWYPAQASAYMTGTIQFRGKTYSLNKAPAYQDRNWGRSLPKWWVWIVSNHFVNDSEAVLSLGGGRPKFLEEFSIKDGLGIGLRYKGVDYAWRSPDLDDITMNVNFGTWEVVAIDREKKNKIEISAYAPKEKFMLLSFLSPSGETFNDYEALKGNLQVKLYKKENEEWKLKADLLSEEAGIEYGSFDIQGLQQLFHSQTTIYNN